MYGIFTYIYHRNQPNVGIYIIHGSLGIDKFLIVVQKQEWGQNLWATCMALEVSKWLVHGFEPQYGCFPKTGVPQNGW